MTITKRRTSPHKTTAHRLLVAAALPLAFAFAFACFACLLLPIGVVDALIVPSPHRHGCTTAIIPPFAGRAYGTRSHGRAVSGLAMSNDNANTDSNSNSNGDNESRFSLGEILNPPTDGVPSSPLDRPVLSAIDAASLLVFAGIGKASHSAVDGSIDPLAVLATAFPFLVSWFLVAPLVGSYKPGATKDVSSAAVQSARAWIIAVPLGCVLRGVIKGYVPPLPFVIVTMISTLVILGAGRVGYTVLSELYVEMF